MSLTQWLVVASALACSAVACRPSTLSNGAPAPIPQKSATPRPGRPAVVATSSANASLPKEIRAVWLTHYEYMKGTEATWRAMAEDLVRSHVNTVYLAMYSDAHPLWNSAVFREAAQTSEGQDWAKRLIPVFRERGLRVGAWFEYGLAVGGETSPLARLHPDWLQRDVQGRAAGHENGMVFLSPAVPAAADFIVALVRELSEKYDWDEVQVDRFRYTRATAAGREFGYEKIALESFGAMTGHHGDAPDKDDAAWVRYREELVNGLVKRIYEAIKQVKPTVLISTSPVGYYGIKQHLQRWGDWLCGGYMDFVTPQIYESSLEGFKSHFKLLAEIASKCGKLDRFAAGVDASKEADGDLVEQELRHAASQGVRHSALWVYHTYTGGIAIRDNLDLMRQPGHIWEVPPPEWK